MEENKETVEDVKVEETGEEVTQPNNEEETEKTFTQEDVDKIVKERLKKMPSKDELRAFKDWQESQKTAEQKQAEKETEYQKALSEKESLAQENLVLKSGVNIDDVDYVVFKVSKKEGDFEDNLQEFLKENPKYLNNEQYDVADLKATGTPVKAISSRESGVMAILKAKHPELYEK